jgi:hypothetical protein
MTPYSKVLLEEEMVLERIKKLHTFYVSRRFIAVFTTGWLLSLSSAISIQSTLSILFLGNPFT